MLNFINFNIQPNKFCIYSRVSSKKQYTDATGLDYQDLLCETYVAEIFGIQQQNQANTLNYYCDVGSAYNQISNLTGLKLLLKDLEPNTVILVSEISRIGRNVCQLIPIFKKISDKNCWIISVSEGLCFNKSKLMDKQIYQKVIDAERESDLISIRTSNANKFIKLNGGHMGQVPYGKQRIKVNNIPILVDCKDELDILSYIKNLYLCHKNIPKVLEELNKKDVKKRNLPWTISSIKNILKKSTIQDITFELNKFKL